MFKKIFLGAIPFLFGIAFSLPTFAAVVVSPTSTSTPSADITVSGWTPGDYFDLYSSNQSLPILCHTGLNIGTSFDLNSVTENGGCTPGSFTSSTTGTYKVVTPTVTACEGQTYSTCSATNPNIPGSLEADFTLTSTSTPATPAYSTSTVLTTTNQDIFFTYLSYMCDLLIIGFFAWLMIKIMTWKNWLSEIVKK